MSDRSNFWKTNAQWPNDSESHVFLAGALRRLGKTMFPDTWSGAELSIDAIKLADYVMCDDRLANNFLAEHQPNSGRQIIPPKEASNVVKGLRGEGDPTGSRVTDAIEAIKRNSGLDIKISESEWKDVLRIAAQLDFQNEPFIQRAQKVKTEFVRLAREGTLATSYRSLGAPADIPIPPVWWDADNVEFRFYCGQLDPKSPFGDAGVGGAWIFVSRESLTLVTADAALSNRVEPETEHSARRYSHTAAETEFKKWRASRGNDIPTELEDIAHMQRFNVGRDKVRDLRKSHPRLPRGRRRTLN
jgi:hypothetical protein